VLTELTFHKPRRRGLAVLSVCLAAVAPGAAQTIEFDSIPNKIFGISPFPIAAQASSGAPVSVKSITPAVCENSDNLVMLLSAGTCSLTASLKSNGSSGAGTPVTRSFTASLANPAGTLVAAPGSPFVAGSGLYSVAVGDFNGDGKQDLVTEDYFGGNVVVLLGDGKGGFTPAAGSPFAAGAVPVAVTVGDFNGDGNQDLAVSNVRGTVTVLLGDGSGGFTEAPGSPFNAGTSPYSIAVGDFNGDGIQDLAVGSLNLGVNTVTVLLGNGVGGFAPAPGSPFAVGEGPLSIVVGDFNGDGIQDLATANLGDFDGNTVTVLLGDGTGGFAPAPGSPFTVGTEPWSIAVGDFNGDGIPDLAAATGAGVTVLLGNGLGGFTVPTGSQYAVGGVYYPPGAVFLTVGDFNGDGIPDLAARGESDNITVLLGAKAATSSTLSTTSPLTVAQGQAVPLTLTVSDTTSAFDAPTGTETFSDGATNLGTASQSGSPYTFSTSSLTVGSHTLSATYGGDTRSLASTSNTLTVEVTAPPPNLPTVNQSNGIVNGASFLSGIAPNSWITLYGTNLSSLTDTWANAITGDDLPTSLDGVKVSVGGEPAYIAYVSPTQINALAPNIGPGTVAVTVTNSNGTGSPISAAAQTVQPAFFQWGNYAVATRQDYSYAVKNGTFSTATTPAKPGDVIVLWGTGFGTTSPVAPVGVVTPSTTVYNTASPVTVTVGGAPATVYGAALTGGNAGLYQVAIQIPTALANGDYPVIATISGVPSPATTLITVQQ